MNPAGLGEADIKTTTVALPAGTVISPSAADGLQACTIAEIGFEKVNADGTDEFTPGKASCPDASKIANVHIKTPLLEGEVTGSIYLAAPQNFKFAGAPRENPFDSLLAVYLVAEEKTGVLVKLPGEVTLCKGAGEDPLDAKGEPIAGVTCQGPGQIITVFEHTPQLPYSEAKLEFYGTDRAPLATPALCGTYTTTSSSNPGLIR